MKEIEKNVKRSAHMKNLAGCITIKIIFALTESAESAKFITASVIAVRIKEKLKELIPPLK